MKGRDSIFGKISFIYIIKAHIKTLRNDETGKFRKGEIFFFLIFPLIIAYILVFCPFHIFLNTSLVNTLLIIFSLAIPLLTSVLILMYDFGRDTKIYSKTADTNLKLEVAEETANSIMFSILICLSCVICLSVLSLNQGMDIYITKIFSFISYYFMGVLLLTVFIILRGIFLILIIFNWICFLFLMGFS